MDVSSDQLIKEMERDFRDAFRYGTMSIEDRLRLLHVWPLEDDESRLDRSIEIRRQEAALAALQPSKPYAKKKRA